MAIDDPNINIGLKELVILMFRHGTYLIKPNVFLNELGSRILFSIWF